MSDEFARNFGFGSFSALTGVEGNDTGGATFLGFGSKKVKKKSVYYLQFYETGLQLEYILDKNYF